MYIPLQSQIRCYVCKQCGGIYTHVLVKIQFVYIDHLVLIVFPARERPNI